MSHLAKMYKPAQPHLSSFKLHSWYIYLMGKSAELVLLNLRNHKFRRRISHKIQGYNLEHSLSPPLAPFYRFWQTWPQFSLFTHLLNIYPPLLWPWHFYVWCIFCQEHCFSSPFITFLVNSFRLNSSTLSALLLPHPQLSIILPKHVYNPEHNLFHSPHALPVFPKKTVHS